MNRFRHIVKVSFMAFHNENDYSSDDDSTDSSTSDTEDDENGLVKRMQALGYKADDGGICFGIANLAMRYFIMGMIEKFDQILKAIYSIDLDKFEKKINAVKKIVKENAKRRKKHLPEKPLSKNNKIKQEICAFFDEIELFQNLADYP